MNNFRVKSYGTIKVPIADLNLQVYKLKLKWKILYKFLIFNAINHPKKNSWATRVQGKMHIRSERIF